MITHQLSLGIDAPNEVVWAYVSEMGNWASNMPGYRTFEELTDSDTRWTLKIGVAALVRTVNVLVHIDEWAGPERVAFTYRLDNDPVDGAGFYRAVARPDGGTDITLDITINGQGPMAPAWEALAKPILPKLALGFAMGLKAKIEEAWAEDPRSASTSVAEAKPTPAVTWPRALWRWLCGYFRKV